MSKSSVYLDNNATTELSGDAASVVMDIVTNNLFGNPSSTHEAGIKIRTLIDAARYGVAQSLCCSSEEIVFTSGGTESNNLALRGTYHSDVGGPDELIMSAGEHPSVFNTVENIAGDDKTRIIPLKPDGSLDLEWADRLITEDTALVSVMLANSETGVIFPVKEIVDIAHKRGALVHCDAVQAYGKIDVNVKDLGVDLLSISGHKAHALPGIGALYVRRGVMVNPRITGGGQEKDLRGGTENYVGIATLGTVANEIYRQKNKLSPGLRDAFEEGLSKRLSDISINGKDVSRVPNTSSITFKGIPSISMLTALSEQGVYASAGTACSSGATRLSKTLLSMEMSEEEAISTIRFSFSKMSTLMDVATAIEACVKCVNTLRRGAESKKEK